MSGGFDSMEFVKTLLKNDQDFQAVVKHLERCLSVYPRGQYTVGHLSHLPSSSDFVADVCKTAERALSAEEFIAFRLVWVEGRVRTVDLPSPVSARIKNKCVAAWRKNGIIPLDEYFRVHSTFAKELARNQRIERAQQLRADERELERKAAREKEKYLKLVWKRVASFKDWLENAADVDPRYRKALGVAEKRARRMGATAPQ